MIFITMNSAVLRIPENNLHCWQDMVAKGIYQRLKHTIVRDTYCCTTLKVTAISSQLYRETSNCSQLLGDTSHCCVKVTYKCVVFKVSVGDLLHGTIEEITEHGIILSFDRVHDLLVPVQNCQKFYGGVQDWASKYKVGDLVCFRICYIRFDDSLTEKDEPVGNGFWYRIYGKIV